MSQCLRACGLYPSQGNQTHANWRPWMLKYDVASRVSFCAICLLGTLGIILMGLGMTQAVHPIAGIVVLCSTLIPISIICSLRSSAGQAYTNIYSRIS